MADINTQAINNDNDDDEKSIVDQTTDMLRSFSEGKSFTHFDKAIRDVVGGFVSEEEPVISEETSGTDQQIKSLLFDSQSNTYFYPEERARAAKIASKLDNYPDTVDPANTGEEDIISRVNKLNQANESRPSVPTDQTEPQQQGPDFDPFEADRLPPETSVFEDVGNFFGADLVTREGGGFNLLAQHYARAINQDLKAAQVGGAKGLAALPQLMQVVYKYGFGTIEQGVRGAWGLSPWGEGMVDYDRLIMSNTLWKNASDESEAIVRDFEKFLGLGPTDTAENILMFTADLAVPLGYPHMIYKALKTAATVGNQAHKMLPMFVRPVPTSVASVETKNMEPVLKAETEFKEAQVKSGKTWKQASSNWNKTPQGRQQKQIDNDPDVSSSWQQAMDVGQKRADAKDRILKEGLKEIRDSEGRKLTWGKWGDGWWQWNPVAKVKDITRGESALGRRKTGEYTDSGVPLYEDVLLINKSTPEQIEQAAQYRKLLQGQAVVSAGALSGTWQSYTEGTELEEFSYAVGMLGMFATPSATMRLIDLIASNTVTAAQRLKAPSILFPGMSMPGTGGDAGFELSLPALLHLGGLMVNRAGTLLRGEAPTDIFETTWGKKVSAMSRGIPFYKVMFLNNTKKLKMAGEETGATALDAAISLHGVNIRAQEKMAVWIENNMPQEFIDSIDGLFQYGFKLEKRLQAIGREDKLTPFFLTMDDLLGAIRLQMEGAVVGQMTKDKAFSRSIYGFKSTEAEASNILTTMRVSNQEAMERLNGLEDSIRDLIGGDARLAEEFKGLNQIIQTLVKTSRGKNLEATNFFKELSDKSNIFLNQEKTLELNKLLKNSKEEGGFGLIDDLGIGTNLRNKKRAAFGTSVRSQTDYFYNIQRQAKDREYEALIENDYDTILPASPFLEGLEELRRSTLEDFGSDIFRMLKNRNRLMVFGSNKDIESGQDAIDGVIAYARFSGLAKTPFEEMRSLLLGITDRTSRQGKDLDLHSYTFREPELGTLKTLKIPEQGADSKNRIGSLFNPHPNGDGVETYLEVFARDQNIPKEEYLRRIISNLNSNDEAVRTMLASKIQQSLTVGELHSIKSSLGGWSYANRSTPAGRKAHKLVGKMDDSFEEAGIESVKRANKAYSDWRSTWHDSFIGKKLAETDEEKARIRGSVDNESLLEIFFQTDSTESAGRLVKEMFGDLKGYKINEEKVLVKDPDSTIVFDTERSNIMEAMDLSLGQLLWKTQGRGLGNTNKAIEKVQKLAQQKVISEQAALNAENYLKIAEPHSKEWTSVEFKHAENRVDTILKNISREMDEAVEQSLIGKLAKSDNTSAELHEFLVPKQRADTASLAPEMAEESIGKSIEDLRRITTDVRKRMADEYGDDIVNIPEDELLKQLDDLSTTPAAQLITTRTDAVIRDIAGIKDQAAFEQLALRAKRGETLSSAESVELKRGIEALESIRDILIGDTLRKARPLIAERAPALRQSLSIADPAKYNFNEGYFALNKDIDIAAFGNMLDDLQPFLNKVNKLSGNAEFTDDLNALFSGLVALKSTVPEMAEGLANIPRGLTTSAALSRLYSGFRGVVSWRYLASEQLIREHQRRKGLMLHAILTDPDFVKQISSLIEGNRFTAKESKIFVTKLKGIMGSRMAVYNPDKSEMDYEPSDSDVMRGIKAILVPAGAKYRPGYEEDEIGAGMFDRSRRKQRRERAEYREEGVDWPMSAGKIQTPFRGYDEKDNNAPEAFPSSTSGLRGLLAD